MPPWLALVFATAPPPIDAGAPPPDAGIIALPVTGFDRRWSVVTKPSPGPPVVIGQPGAGCVEGAHALPLRGPGFLVVRPERHRHFGHPTLIAFVRGLARRARAEKLPTLLVGDLGQPRGGPTPTGHRSHQSGLDVDLWYAPPKGGFVPGRKPAPPAPSMVSLRTKKMLPAWNPRVARLLELAGKMPEVDRIFVHPAVKRALCQDPARRGPWLRVVRPWWGHDEHLHVRLRCPEGSSACVPGAPLPPGDGCDAGLDWWLSGEAAKAAAKRPPPGRGAPAMPAACARLLEDKPGLD